MTPASRLNHKASNFLGGFLLGLAILSAGSNGFAAPRIVIDPIVSGLRYPVDINHAADGSGRLFVIEQEGRIKIIRNGSLKSTPFLNITDRVACCGERGLLGVAFHPDYQTNGYFYVNYTSQARAGIAGPGDTIIARYAVSADDIDLADPDSEAIILVVPQPYSNHNAGKLLFSPVDGYLYIPLGDGGSGNDPGNRSQDPGTLLGKVLRIDVDSAFPYTIPPDNPFVNESGTLDEIWALGMRNPWRFSFDRLTGDMYIGDVGQGAWEEIDYEAAGSSGGINFGWRCREGANDTQFSSECAGRVLTDPIAEYGRSEGRSVTGGFLYRGDKYRALRGQYFFADYVLGNIWTIQKTDSDFWSMPDLELATNLNISTFGEDESGELYFAHRSSNNGTVYRVMDICEAGTAGDRNLDGLNIAEFAMNFVPGVCDGNCPGDLNGDGGVDGSDFKVLADDYGRTDCPN